MNIHGAFGFWKGYVKNTAKLDPVRSEVDCVSSPLINDIFPGNEAEEKVTVGYLKNREPINNNAASSFTNKLQSQSVRVLWPTKFVYPINTAGKV
jgi:hypothetical protein